MGVIIARKMLLTAQARAIDSDIGTYCVNYFVLNFEGSHLLINVTFQFGGRQIVCHTVQFGTLLSIAIVAETSRV